VGPHELKVYVAGAGEVASKQIFVKSGAETNYVSIYLNDTKKGTNAIGCFIHVGTNITGGI
jgi:hypothetical protein